MAHHQGIVAAILVAPVAISIGVFAAFGLPIVLPAYVSAAPAIAVLSLGFVVLAGLAGYGNYLNVVGAQWQYLRLQLLAVLVAGVLMTIGGLGFGLTGIAAGMSLGHLAYGLLLRRAASRIEAPHLDSASAAQPGTADYPVSEISESLMRAHDT
jgi:O-antigen/teichoic acid export membrane protein